MILTLLLAPIVALLWLPALSELLCFFRPRRAPRRRDGPLPRLLFLVPAHNEELLIGGCVQSLMTLDYPTAKRRVVVIADNCSDATASVVRANGAECLERAMPDRGGKPYAIAWALEQIDLAAWDATVIIDADTVVAPDFARGIAELGPVNDIVFQGNFGTLNEFDNWLTRLGGLLSRCRYQITYPIKQAAGLNCPVTGNGMGFGTNLLMKDGWRSFSITEDSELYASYTTDGIPIIHARNATLFSQEAQSLGQGATQRRRWLAGRLNVIRTWTGPLLRSKRIGWHQKLDAFVELGLASPVIHLIVAVLTAAVAAAVLRGGERWLVIGLALGSLIVLIVTTLAALWRHPEPFRTIGAFAMLPVYAGWRAAVAVGTVFTLSDATWRKTERTPLSATGVTGGAATVTGR